jgi:acyl-coenzyme A synthetase/AMP-(fatty) acid ligase
VEFWTSGTTGDPKAVPKDLAQLDAEVSMLEAAFGERLGSGPMVGTVPHYHIYGCLFRILWPLATGRPFLCEPCGEPAGFRQAMAQAPALISSPAHLSRLPSLMELSELPAFPCVVFSSGGPLDRKDALAWRRWVPAGVVEIYGSTESGGIAWRCQDEDAESSLWTPLADVALTLAPDGALVVASFRAGPGPLRMEDLAEPASGGRFRLLGRLDRTIKLEEKRVSLPELEAALEAHPLVERAAVVLLEGRRPTLGAVVVLRGAQAQERRQLIRTLRLHLAQRFEPVALPRRWRFLDHLPFDLKGKLTAQTLAALFQREEGQS